MLSYRIIEVQTTHLLLTIASSSEFLTIYNSVTFRDKILKLCTKIGFIFTYI